MSEWDTPFDPSMLEYENGVVISCPERYLANELFEIFREAGIGQFWFTNVKSTKWEDNQEETAYYVSGNRLLYGPRSDAEDVSYEYINYTKCTFYGTSDEASQDFDAVDGESLLAFLTS